MSWMEALYRTYENNQAEHMANPDDPTPLLPVCLSEQNAHVHVILDGKGAFQDARVISKKEASGIILVTEGSAGRTAKINPHPLFDKLQYLASDYVERGGEKKKHGFKEYLEQLNGWCDSPHGHPKVKAVRDYLGGGTLVADLVARGVLHADSGGKLLREWADKETPAPEIFGVIPSKDQREAFIRFSVNVAGESHSDLWTDKTVWKSWADYYLETENADTGLCYVTGERRPLAANHPKRIRYGGDGAKLISSNDTSGFTFRGKCDKPSEVCGVGYEVTQKAHNALRWLLARQGMTDSGLAVVAWAVEGKEVPSPGLDLNALLEEASSEAAVESDAAGRTLARRFARKLVGYRADLTDTDQVVVMAMDSATPGRMGVKYYRELTGSEYLERIERWHRECSWMQRYGKGRRFIGPPTPRMIVSAAYGGRADDKLRKATIERLLPCIIDSVPIHRDLVDSCVRRACNRAGLEPWEWEECLGVACALYRYHTKDKEGFAMALESERTTRAYLYGRLLAFADHIEQSALTDAELKRSTTAARLMQRFADRPYSTWRNLELALAPYQSRLAANKPGLAQFLNNGIRDIFTRFEGEDFRDDTPLEGEFLLGFHCQQSELWKKKKDRTEAGDTE